ncbi:unnamed protein product [Somion occarium]|uniref:DUF6532 domain-containing protein n=1 Tax=Somion occarium TaxID=3059160 RepID=A0ABP1D5Z6_9APHY
MPDSMIALACTIIFYAIQEYSSGFWVDSVFHECQWQSIYFGHIESLKLLKDTSTSEAPLYNWLKSDLMEDARRSAGIIGSEKTQSESISLAAFQAEIAAYECSYDEFGGEPADDAQTDYGDFEDEDDQIPNNHGDNDSTSSNDEEVDDGEEEEDEEDDAEEEEEEDADEQVDADVEELDIDEDAAV